jgi:hypothetical protein
MCYTEVAMTGSIVSKRRQVEVVQIRAEDVQVGDVVNRAGNQREGWFEVAAVESLPDGRLNIADAKYQQSVMTAPLDLLWLQIVRPLHGNSHLALADGP